MYAHTKLLQIMTYNTGIDRRDMNWGLCHGVDG